MLLGLFVHDKGKMGYRHRWPGGERSTTYKLAGILVSALGTL